MSAKKETKIQNKKISIASLPINQRSPSSKNNNKPATVPNSSGLKDTNPVSKIDNNCPLATNKSSPTRTSRNQVSANWNSVAGALKSQRTTSSAKKTGTKLSNTLNSVDGVNQLIEFIHIFIGL